MAKNRKKKSKSSKANAPRSVSDFNAPLRVLDGDDFQSMGHLREHSTAQIQPKSENAPPVTPPSLSKTYLFEREIGHGSQGKIFRAMRLFDQKEVVIKQLCINSIKSWKEYELFHREAEILQKLDLPGVAKFYDAIDCLEDNPPCSYIVQELIAGKSLQQMLDDGHRFATNEIYDILIQTLKILRELHRHEPPIIHRDIKPSNLMITPMKNDGYSVTVIDFGAVANPQVQGGGSTVAGTYGYMPPEQLMGKPVPASDIYALAAVAVQLFSGKSPANLPVKDFNLIFEPEMQSKPRELVSLLRKMLEPNLNNRLDNILLIIHTLEQFKKGEYSSQNKSNKHKGNEHSKSFEMDLSHVETLFDEGNVELWKQLSDIIPRELPKIFTTISQDHTSQLKAHKETISKRTLPRMKSLLIRLLHFPQTILLKIIPALLSFLLCTLKKIPEALFYTFLYVLVFFIFITLISLVVALFAGKFSFIAWTIIVDYYPLIIALFVIILLILTGCNYAELKDNPLQNATENDNSSHRLSRIHRTYTDKQIKEQFSFLLENGHKTIAQILDISYIPMNKQNIRTIKSKGKSILKYDAYPNFQIQYRFNPPDDSRSEDIIHSCITHVSAGDNIQPGSPLPILYFTRIEKPTETVWSMPFPLPIKDIKSYRDIVDYSVAEYHKRRKRSV